MTNQGRRIQVFEAPVSESSHSDQASRSNKLRIACYNIAHGRGLAADNWTEDTPRERLERLDQIAVLLKDLNADLVALNEVDFLSSWSHGVNQAKYLAQKAGYQYWAQEVNLDFRVGFYTWRFGNAVLSRYPIEAAEEISFPSYRAWEDWLAGKKRGLLCRVKIGTGEVSFVSAHLSHRSEQLRVESAQVLAQMATASLHPFILAGDLNSTPPGFALSEKTGEGTNTITELDASGYFDRQPQIMPDDSGMTFRSDDPTHVIDWILVPKDAKFEDYQVIDSKLSDHRAVVAEIGLAEPEQP